MVAVQWVPADQWVARMGAVPVNGGATAGAEVALGGELKLDDKNGNNLREENYDPAAYLGLRVVGRF